MPAHRTSKTARTPIDDLRGATRLAVEATRSVTDLVEAMHHNIAGALAANEPGGLAGT